MSRATHCQNTSSDTPGRGVPSPRKAVRLARAVPTGFARRFFDLAGIALLSFVPSERIAAAGGTHRATCSQVPSHGPQATCRASRQRQGKLLLFLLLGIFFFVGAIVPAGHRPPEDRWAKLSRSDIAILDPDRPDAALLTLNALTGSLVEVAEGLLTAQTHAAGWISCYCRRGPAEPYQSLVIPVAQADRAIRLEPGDPPPRLALFPARRVLTYLDRLKIEGAERPVPADGAYRAAPRRMGRSRCAHRTARRSVEQP